MRRFLSLRGLSLLFLGAIFFCPSLFAYDASIIRVTNKLRMTREETSPPKDYYVNLGARQGLKPGDNLEVFRQISVVDEKTGQHHDFVKVMLGELQVKVVGEFTSVANIAKQVEPQGLPVLEYPWFMIGDGVQLKTSLPFQP